MFGTTVFDKDGVSAAAVVMEMVGFLKKNGLTLSSKLQEIYNTYGHFLSHNSYFICSSKQSIANLFSGLRKNKKVVQRRFFKWFTLLLLVPCSVWLSKSRESDRPDCWI